MEKPTDAEIARMQALVTSGGEARYVGSEDPRKEFAHVVNPPPVVHIFALEDGREGYVLPGRFPAEPAVVHTTDRIRSWRDAVRAVLRSRIPKA